jgi:hypothetical protein
MNHKPWQAIFITKLYYPFRQWQINSRKQVKVLFFEKREYALILHP